MLRFDGRFVRYAETWFDEPIPVGADVDIIKARQRPSPFPSCKFERFLTLLSDLTLPEDELFMKFGKTNRYKIKRADTRDGLTYRYFAEPLPVLDTFCTFYDAFAEQKNLFGCYRRSLFAAAKAGQLSLSHAASDRGTPLVWHAYIGNGTRAILLHTTSHFRSAPPEQRGRIARANRWLHWRDMLTLKAHGYRRMCWGGMFENEDPPEHMNINNFKREFGGEPDVTYECTIPVTVRGRLAVPALALLDSVDRSWRRLRPSSERTSCDQQVAAAGQAHHCCESRGDRLKATSY